MKTQLIHINDVITAKAELLSKVSFKGDNLAYSSRVLNENYAIDLSPWGCISKVGEDAENQTIRFDSIARFTKDWLKAINSYWVN